MGLPEFESGSPAPKAGRMDHCSRRPMAPSSYPTAPLTEDCRPISIFAQALLSISLAASLTASALL